MLPVSASVELTVTAIAALAAAGGLGWNIIESRTRATFDHLRAIQQKLEPVWGDPEITKAERELIDWYDGEGAELTGRARAYLDLLTELDLMAFACERGLIRTGVAKEWLRTLFEREVAVSASFIVRIQEAVEDRHAFEHLLKFARKHFPSEPE